MKAKQMLTAISSSAVMLLLLATPVLMSPAYAAGSGLNLTSATTDCPGINAIASATSGNDGSSIAVSATIVGNTVHHLISLPTNVELIEECVYPNGGDLSTVSSESTAITDWTAGLNCVGASVNTCVHAIRNHGFSNIVGPTTNTDDLDITYTTVVGLTWVKAIHVLDNVPGNAGPCGATGQTCFVFPGTPPPVTTTTVTTTIQSVTGTCTVGQTTGTSTSETSTSNTSTSDETSTNTVTLTATVTSTTITAVCTFPPPPQVPEFPLSGALFAALLLPVLLLLLRSRRSILHK